VNTTSAPFCGLCGTELPAHADAAPAGELVGADGTTQVVTGVMSIGRDPRNAIVLADPAVSRIHCRIEGRAGTVLLSDLNSTNGTWVNGRRIDHEELANGDRVAIGRTEFVFRTFGRE
jgi:pSer/pThr/pTyr-binding forkhead associated (FHA) protein